MITYIIYVHGCLASSKSSLPPSRARPAYSRASDGVFDTASAGLRQSGLHGLIMALRNTALSLLLARL